jgi:hypothetical protein
MNKVFTILVIVAELIIKLVAATRNERALDLVSKIKYSTQIV